ncbi:MAG: hypothetical protein AAF266_00780 [Planctomycetota bacterium]
MSFEVRDPRFDPEPPRETLEEEDRRRGRGCLFWGCLVTAIVFLVLLIGIPLGIYFTAKHYVNKFTTEEPAEIAVVELPEEQLAELTGRFEVFDQALENNEAPPDLELTAEEINGLISTNDELRGLVFVRIKDGQVGGNISIPTDDFPGGGGRFFNATVDFEVSLMNGQLVVMLADASVNGTPLPQSILDTFAGENLAKDAKFDQETEELLAKFESIEVVDDRIVLRAKPSAEPAEQEPASAEIEDFETVETPQRAATVRTLCIGFPQMEITSESDEDLCGDPGSDAG